MRPPALVVSFFALCTVLSCFACQNSSLIVTDCVATSDCPEGYVCDGGSCEPGFMSPDGDGESDTPDGDGEADGTDGDGGDNDTGETDADTPLPDGDMSDGDIDTDLWDSDLSDGDGSDGDSRETDAEPEIPIGNDCANAPFLPLDTPTYGTTRGATDDFNPGESCLGSPLAGPDVVFRLTLEPGAEIKVTLVPTTEGYNPAVYLLASCEAQAACLAGADAGRAGEADSFGYYSETGGDVWLVIDSVLTTSGGAGDFVVSAQRYPPVSTCEACSADAPDCGPGAGCAEFSDAEGVVETACVTVCDDDGDCEAGFVCKNTRLVAGGVATHCLPKYDANQLHVLATCSAMLDIGTPCIWRPISDNDAACGADEGGRAVDDAVCFFFPELTDFVSYCTIYCVDDSECPQGYFCYKVPLTQSDHVCKLR